MPVKNTFIGIDPGTSGGIAVIGNGIKTYNIPNEEIELFRVLEKVVKPNCHITIEQQIPRPTRLLDRQTGKWTQSILKSTCVLYGQYLQIRGMLVALEVRFNPVVPETWQRGLQIPGKKQSENNHAWKSRLKKKAQELFPETKVTLKTCDALLLAEYQRRQSSRSFRIKRFR